jgi:tRNA threonylcarbamoyladenosine biosynthesis protein TsaB
LLLALDTATATASLAVCDLERRQVLAEVTWQARRRHTQDLLVTASWLLAQCGHAPGDLTALAVTTGPGSFTGVRIGISAVKGIALGLPRPPRVLGLPTLSVTAVPWLALAARSQPAATVCTVLQAGRGRYNWVVFAGDPLYCPAADEHRAGASEELAAELAGRAPQPLWLAGEVADDLAAAVAGLAHVTVVDPVSGLRRSGHLARLALLHFDCGHVDDLHALQPLYLHTP